MIVWNTSGMILVGENQTTWKTMFSINSLSATNPISAGVGSVLVLCGENIMVRIHISVARCTGCLT
jgi:hypothetical protein